MSESPGQGAHRSIVRAPQSLFAGLGMVGLGLFGVYAASDLPQGTLSAIGPGLMPHWLSIGVAVCGLALVAAGFLRDGEPLQTFPLRGPIIVMLAIAAFALTIRPFNFGAFSTPGLGLIVAGPLAVMVGGYASPEARFRELLILALLLTAGCMLLFGDMLNLPIPIFPTAVIQAMSGVVPSKTLLRIGAGSLALLGLALLALNRRTAHRENVDVAHHSMTA